MGKTSSEVKNRWNSEHYKRFVVSIPHEDAKAYEEKCKALGISKSQVLKDAVYEFLEDESK